MKKIIGLLFTTVLFVSCHKLCDFIPQPSGAIEADVIVPGTSNPWLAGMPNGTAAIDDDGINVDEAPAQSPVLVPIKLFYGNWIQVSNVTGTVSNGLGYPIASPEGGDTTSHVQGPEHGKSDVNAPFNSLVGVFLDDDVPTGKAPKASDFSTQETRDYLDYHPELKQLFFIGDGKTSGGLQQKIFIPKGATRLFLGTMDGWTWNDNSGAFKATITTLK